MMPADDTPDPAPLRFVGRSFGSGFSAIDLRDPQVGIACATMGRFFFEVEGRNTVARVRRVEQTTLAAVGGGARR